MPPTYTGGCQCGSVRYELTGEPIRLSVVHCNECQRQSDSAIWHVRAGKAKRLKDRRIYQEFCPCCRQWSREHGGFLS